MQQSLNQSLPQPVAAEGAKKSAATQRRTIIATSLGNGLELFDFTVFSYFAVIIGKLFFPVSGEYGSLLLALATFGAGFVMRPIGSVLIGNYADRAGRKPALGLTIWLMALGTGLIGLAPTYEQIGLFAPLLILVGRLLQGFSAGGEIGAATSFLMESGQRRQRGYRVSWQMASQGAAALAGALCGVILTRTLPTESLESWGWRLPFLLGLLIGPVGMYIRSQLEETHSAPSGKRSAVSVVFTRHGRQLLLGSLLILAGTACTYVMVFYMPSYMIKTLRMAPENALLTGCTAGLCMLVTAPFAGRLADRFERRRPLLLILSLCSIASIWPAFSLIESQRSLPVILTAVVLLVGLMTVAAPAGFLLVLESFPRDCRATGLSIVYACGVTLFGGFAQFIVTWLISRTANPMMPAWYMLVCSSLSLLALALFREQPSRD